MRTLKKVMMGILLAVFTLPLYAQSVYWDPQDGVYFTYQPETTYAVPTYSVPAYSAYCLQWVPQQVDENNNWIPGHYVNVCYSQFYPYPYYGYGLYSNGLYYHYYPRRH